MEKEGLEYEWLKPIMKQTFENVLKYDPYDLQTGPGIRKDEKTINEHVKLIKDETYSQVYLKITESIIKTYNFLKGKYIYV